jgi:hypothetical protein
MKRSRKMGKMRLLGHKRLREVVVKVRQQRKSMLKKKMI